MIGICILNYLQSFYHNGNHSINIQCKSFDWFFYLTGMLGLSELRNVWYLSTWLLLIYFISMILSFSDVIRGYRKRPVKWNGLNCTTQISDQSSRFEEILFILTHYCHVLLIYTPENIRKPLGFRMFSSGIDEQNWALMCFNLKSLIIDQERHSSSIYINLFQANVP